MKTFEDVCRMTQQEVKKYMKKYLTDNKYEVVDQDGFLYAKGTVPVLLVAHMDTVHRQKCKTIVHVDNKLSSPQGIGGDDRCGVFIIMNLVKELHCSVLLCEDEEKGCIGASKFKRATYKDAEGNEQRYIKNLDVNYMVEFDRRGKNDAVFYHCGNEEFIDFIEDMTNFKFANGSMSDISALMEEANLSAVNLSCGYYNAHTTCEYVIYDEMMDTVDAATALIKEKCDKPFVYVKKKTSMPPSWQNFNNSHKSYTPGYAKGYEKDEYYGSLFDSPAEYKDEHLANIALSDNELELEVTIYGPSLSEQNLLAVGDTKAECWMNMFLENPNLCFNDIIDYTWG
jgi:hypothetical protein